MVAYKEKIEKEERKKRETSPEEGQYFYVVNIYKQTKYDEPHAECLFEWCMPIEDYICSDEENKQRAEKMAQETMIELAAEHLKRERYLPSSIYAQILRCKVEYIEEQTLSFNAG